MKMTGPRFNPTLGESCQQAIPINRACGRRSRAEKVWEAKGELELGLIQHLGN
jgi:hypothetical protein